MLLSLQLVTRAEYEHILERRLAVAESRAQNSYHCQTADCLGWCIYEDDVNEFRCPICWALNCLVCKVSWLPCRLLGSPSPAPFGWAPSSASPL